MDNFNSTPASQEDMSYETGMGNDTMLTNDYLAYLEMYSMNWNIIESLLYIEHVFNIVTICIELPVICWAVFALYHQVKADNVTPVYVINLLISDLIQIIGRIMYLQASYGAYYQVQYRAGLHLLHFGLVTSILLIVCIALERYLLVVHPLWYRCRRTIKHSILLLLAVYVSDVLLITAWSLLSFEVTQIGGATILILPLPFLVFFLGATWRALSHSISVPHTEKKRILGTLALVLLIYLVLFFPSILAILFPYKWSQMHYYISLKMDRVAYMFLDISPLMDALLYILIKKDARYTLKVPHCCRRLCTHKESRETSTVPTENVTSV